jgi:hypothetical protein
VVLRVLGIIASRGKHADPAAFGETQTSLDPSL